MKGIDATARHHAAIDRIVRFDYRLTCRTGLHIGAGKSSDLAGSDQPVIRDAAGRPLVPGSSLRGVLRAGIESLCASLGLDQPLEAEGDGADATLKAFAEDWRQLKLTRRLFGDIARDRGGFSYASRLQISDAVCEGSPAVELRDGVGIDRETRTAAANVKFDLEVVPAGTAFRGRIRFKNPADHELGLLAQALWMLDEGFLLLGGKSARGLGWMEVAVTPPVTLSALDILQGKPATPEGDFGPVPERLGAFLKNAEELASLAEAG